MHCSRQIHITRVGGSHVSEKAAVVHAVRMLIHHHPFVGWISNVALLEVNLMKVGAIPKLAITLSHVGVHGESADSLGPAFLFLGGADVFVRRAVNQVFAVSLIGCQLGITWIRDVEHVGIIGTQAPVQPAHDPLGVSGTRIIALSLASMGVVHQVTIVISGIRDPSQHQLLAVAET